MMCNSQSRMLRHLFGLFFVSFGAYCGEILVCNSPSRMGAQITTDLYRLFPVTLTYECIHQTKLDLDDDVMCFSIALCFQYQKDKQDRAARCSVLRQRMIDQDLNVNVHIPTDEVEPFASIDPMKKTLSNADKALLYEDFVVEIDPASAMLDFVPRTDKTVFWSTVVRILCMCVFLKQVFVFFLLYYYLIEIKLSAGS